MPFVIWKSFLYVRYFMLIAAFTWIMRRQPNRQIYVLTWGENLAKNHVWNTNFIHRSIIGFILRCISLGDFLLPDWNDCKLTTQSVFEFFAALFTKYLVLFVDTNGWDWTSWKSWKLDFWPSVIILKWTKLCMLHN